MMSSNPFKKVNKDIFSIQPLIFTCNPPNASNTLKINEINEEYLITIRKNNSISCTLYPKSPSIYFIINENIYELMNVQYDGNNANNDNNDNEQKNIMDGVLVCKNGHWIIFIYDIYISDYNIPFLDRIEFINNLIKKKIKCTGNIRFQLAGYFTYNHLPLLLNSQKNYSLLFKSNNDSFIIDLYHNNHGYIPEDGQITKLTIFRTNDMLPDIYKITKNNEQDKNDENNNQNDNILGVTSVEISTHLKQLFTNNGNEPIEILARYSSYFNHWIPIQKQNQ